MEPGPGPWESLSLAVKILVYGGMMATIGGTWMLVLQRHVPDVRHRHFLALYQTVGACLGLTAALVFFLLQVGAINLQGWRGMFDANMAAVLGASSVGGGTRLKALGFFCALLVTVPLLLSSQHPAVNRWVMRLGAPVLLLAILLIAISFAVMGHTAPEALPTRVAVVLHVVAVSLWAGSLVPLIRLASRPEARVAPLMRRFGELAWGIVAVFLLSGGFLLVQMLETVDMLVESAYGRLLLLKLALVTAVMGVGAWNKFRLVPNLFQGGSAGPLRISILLEVLLVVGILAITGWVTTITGPPQGM